MNCRINRQQLLQTLQSVAPGLSPRAIVQQSDCFVFKRGFVYTFNDECSCRAKSPFPKEAAFAAPSGPVLKLLNALPEEVLTARVKEGRLVLSGKGRGTKIRIDTDIVLPLSGVERPDPGAWRKLRSDFGDAVSIVQECVSKDQSQTAISCVHFHPKWLEACDGLQVTRYRIRTRAPEPFLVKKDGLKHLGNLDMTEMALTDSWVHFRNPAGVVLSCRRYAEDFPDMRPILTVEGTTPAVLPKGLAQAAKTAEICSGENKDENHVLVMLKAGEMRVKGIGVTAEYFEDKKLKYTGQPLAFLISPKLLVEITKRHDQVEISKDRLVANGGRWRFVTCLGSPEDVEKQAQKEAADVEPQHTADDGGEE